MIANRPSTKELRVQSLIELAKRMPIDLGQGSVADITEGKTIALGLVPDGHGRRALDIGCREGRQTRWLGDKGYDVTPIDIEAKFAGARVVDANEPLPFDDRTFDVVWCSEVIEHLVDPHASVHEMLRVTRAGGIVVLTTPNSHMLLFKVLALIGLTPQRLQRRDHLHFFDLRAIRRIAPQGTLYGYFPWVLLKRKLKQDRLIGALSPTFVVHLRKAA